MSNYERARAWALEWQIGKAWTMGMPAALANSAAEQFELSTKERDELEADLRETAVAATA